MRVLIFGDRNYHLQSPVWTLLDGLWHNAGDRLVVIEGHAKGADMIAHMWADNKFGRENVENHLCFPADWSKFGRAAGPIRNQQMIDEGEPEVAFGFHDDIINSKGTKDMFNRLTKANVPAFLMSKWS